MSIQPKNLSAALQARIFAAEAHADGVLYHPGFYSEGILAAPSNITADDTVTIGSNVFQFKALTTDSTRTCTLATASAGALSTLTASGTMTWNNGDLLRIENEIVKIVGIYSTTVCYVARGRCGTTIAAHTAAAIYQASSVHATNIPVGVNATLTPAVWLAALAAEINNATAGNSRPTAKASTIYDPGSTYADAARASKVVAIVAPSNAALVVRSAIPEANTLATTEGLTASGNVWVTGSTTVAGAAAAPKRRFARTIVPTAAEVTADNIFRFLPFTPTVLSVDVFVTSTGVRKAWDGGFTVTANSDGSCILKITNAGSTDWAATDNVVVLAAE